MSLAPRAAFWTSAAACASIVCAAPRARAEEPLAKATLVYERGVGAESCPDEAELRQLVALRLGYDPFVASADTHVTVVMGKDAGGLTAHITAASGNERAPAPPPARERDIAAEGDSCKELGPAVVLAVSLAIDPRSFAGPRPVSPASAASPSSPASPSRAEPAAAPTSAVSPPPPRAPSPTPRPKGSSPFRVDLGASLRVGFGIVPKVSVGPMLDARVGGQTFALLVDAGADLPTGSATNSQVSPGTVSGALLWGGVGFCETPFLFFVCGRLDAGALEGTGSGLSEHRTATSFYAGASLLGGITYELRPNLTAGINAELLAPFTRTSLSLDGSSVWTEPSLAATVGLGAGYRY